MLNSATLDHSLAADNESVIGSARVTATSTNDIGAVESTWRRLAAGNLESPGQTVEFIRLWADTQHIPDADRLFVVGEVAGVPVALMPLRRDTRFGVVKLLRWMPGAHVGCNAPIVDTQRLLAMTPDQRRDLWARMLSTIEGGQIVYFGHVPDLPQFAELGDHIPADTLYRSEFATWDEANTKQRNKSRRKHDRQQGERLEALGEVTFAELGNTDDLAPVLDVMFCQRAARFRDMGVDDPFAPQQIRDFYYAAAAPDSPVTVRMHVLRLDGEIVAVRFNIVDGTRMFCLISSMSDDPRIQGGSPGKQCLLRVMQTVFDAGITSFDMGTGFTDEKRHWCNVQIPVRQHYLPLTTMGRLAASRHRTWHLAPRRIKYEPRLLAFAKKVRAVFTRTKTVPVAVKDEAVD
jgi:CelD/BcsL family acetyltransferase involved in cellulose biosynthesis